MIASTGALAEIHRVSHVDMLVSGQAFLMASGPEWGRHDPVVWSAWLTCVWRWPPSDGPARCDAVALAEFWPPHLRGLRLHPISGVGSVLERRRQLARRDPAADDRMRDEAHPVPVLDRGRQVRVGASVSSISSALCALVTSSAGPRTSTFQPDRVWWSMSSTSKVALAWLAA